MSYCSDNTQCYANIISNTHNSSLNHLYLACNKCLKTLSYIISNLFKKLNQWVPIIPEKEAWKDIELLVILSLDWFMPGKSLITIPSNPH